MNKTIFFLVAIASWSLSACIEESELTGADSEEYGDLSLDPDFDPDLAQLADDSSDAVEDASTNELDEFNSDEGGMPEFKLFEVLAADEPWNPGAGYATCNSGWPGSRTCTQTFTSTKEIRPGSVSIRINAGNPQGIQRYDAWQVDKRLIQYTATVNEGDMFDPGKNSASFIIEWQEYVENPGGWDYCKIYGPCDAGEGDCDSSSECAAGLGCVNDIGQCFGFGSTVDVCLPVAR